jgi:hypothetical protein
MSLGGRGLAQRIPQSHGTHAANKGSRDRYLLIGQDVHKVLSIEYTRLQRGYWSGLANSRPQEPGKWQQPGKRTPDGVGMKGRPGQLAGQEHALPQGGRGSSLCGDYRQLKFLSFKNFCSCIYQYFIIFPQRTILHQTFLRRKKLGRAKREVKIKSKCLRGRSDPCCLWVGGAWGQGRPQK